MTGRRSLGFAHAASIGLLVACGPDVTSTGGEIKHDAGLDAAVDSGPCEGCTPCDGGTSHGGGSCCVGCWDNDLCALISSELTCGEHGSNCVQCLGGLVCDAGLCDKP